MKILCVGGAGYLGGAVTDELMKTDHDIRVYDNLTYEEAYLKPVPFIYGDVRDRRQLRSQLNWADVVIWLAAIVGDGACAINPGLATEINQDSVRWLAENFAGRIIFVSTCSVYGSSFDELTEISPTVPLSVYAATKLEAEKYLKDKNALIFRLGTLFGLGDHYSRIRLDLVVNTMTVRAMNEGKVTVFGGDQYRPLLHVRDVARAIVENLTGKIGTYNLSKQNLRVSDIAKLVRNIIPCQLEVSEMPTDDARDYRVSSKAFGFKPKLTVEQGITEIKQLLKDGRIKDMNNPRYSNVGFLSK